MASNNALTVISAEEKRILYAKTSKSLPNNPSESGFSATEIKNKLGYASTVYLISLLDRAIGESNTGLANIYTDLTNYENGTSIAKKAEQDSLGNVISTYYARDADLTSEITRAQTAESTNATGLASEITNRQNAVGIVTSSLSSEASARSSEDTRLQANIESEATTRANADTANSLAISNETVRAQGVESGKAAQASTLAGYGIENAYTKEQIDSKMRYVYHFKGNVATVNDLPTTGNVAGDVYNCNDTTINYGWVEAVGDTPGYWDPLAGTNQDISNYATKSENDAKANKALDNLTGILPVANGGTGNSSVDSTPTSGSAKMVTSAGTKAYVDNSISNIPKKAYIDDGGYVAINYDNLPIVA